jgi:hypothetical protein
MDLKELVTFVLYQVRWTIEVNLRMKPNTIKKPLILH